MNLFGLGRRASSHVVRDDFVPGPRELWIENKSDTVLQIRLEPWSDTVDLPAGHFARLNAHASDDRDEFSVHYYPDAIGVHCPPKTTIAIVEKRA